MTKEKTEVTFTKEQILTSKRYAGRKDVINTVLAENEQISEAELNKKIENFMKGKVK